MDKIATLNRVFSSRLDWNFQTNRLSALRKTKRNVLDLNRIQSDPRAVGISREEILQRNERGRALRYNPEPRGLLSAREAVARYYGGVPASRILFTASDQRSIRDIYSNCLCDPGDEISIAASVVSTV